MCTVCLKNIPFSQDTWLWSLVNTDFSVYLIVRFSIRYLWMIHTKYHCQKHRSAYARQPITHSLSYHAKKTFAEEKMWADHRLSPVMLISGFSVLLDMSNMPRRASKSFNLPWQDRHCFVKGRKNCTGKREWPESFCQVLSLCLLFLSLDFGNLHLLPKDLLQPVWLLHCAVARPMLPLQVYLQRHPFRRTSHTALLKLYFSSWASSTQQVWGWSWPRRKIRWVTQHFQSFARLVYADLKVSGSVDKLKKPRWNACRTWFSALYSKGLCQGNICNHSWLSLKSPSALLSRSIPLEEP